MTRDIEYSPRKKREDDKTVREKQTERREEKKREREAKTNKSFSLFFIELLSHWFLSSTNQRLFELTF